MHTIKKKEEKETTHTYMLREELVVIPSAKEEKVATIVHGISGSNYTIYLQWPLEGEAFSFCDFNGVNLHGPPDFSTQ